MGEAFKALNKEKQKRILDAAFQEFTESSYDQASTNRIAKRAGIGKGTLFYYFKNKENLFHVLVEEAFRIANDYYLSKIDYSITDFFERLRQTSELKWDVYLKQPYAFSFLTQIFMHLEDYRLPDTLIKKHKMAEEIWDSILTRNIDFSRFRDEIPQETASKFIRWTMEGYRIELEQRFKSQEHFVFTNDLMGSYYDEFYAYLEALKKIYYKPEYI